MAPRRSAGRGQEHGNVEKPTASCEAAVTVLRAYKHTHRFFGGILYILEDISQQSGANLGRVSR